MLGTTFMLSACTPEVPTTVPTTAAPTTTTAPVINPAQVTGLKLDRVELVGGDTYNAFFSWEASVTPNVKYCAFTTAEGNPGSVNDGCTWSNQYLTSETQRGFGLVFNKNVDYKVSVMAIDSSDRKSSTSTLTWRVPTIIGMPTELKLDRVENLAGDTYNVYFSWKAPSTPNVKYCVSTTSIGMDGIPVENNFDSNCSYNDPYLRSDPSTGFGLVFNKNYVYTFRVTAVDSNNQKSITNSIVWQLP